MREFLVCPWYGTEEECAPSTHHSHHTAPPSLPPPPPTNRLVRPQYPLQFLIDGTAAARSPPLLTGSSKHNPSLGKSVPLILCPVGGLLNVDRALSATTSNFEGVCPTRRDIQLSSPPTNPSQPLIELSRHLIPPPQATRRTRVPPSPPGDRAFLIVGRLRRRRSSFFLPPPATRRMIVDHGRPRQCVRRRPPCRVDRASFATTRQGGRSSIVATTSDESIVVPPDNPSDTDHQVESIAHRLPVTRGRAPIRPTPTTTSIELDDRRIARRWGWYRTSSRHRWSIRDRRRCRGRGLRRRVRRRRHLCHHRRPWSPKSAPSKSSVAPRSVTEPARQLP